MVLKFPATNDANRAVALAFDIYRREVLFYRDVAALTPAATPEVYFAEIEGKENFILLLEDMSHYRLGDQIEGCGGADAELCMVELGELHASFWNDVDRPALGVHARTSTRRTTPTRCNRVRGSGGTRCWRCSEPSFPTMSGRSRTATSPPSPACRSG